MLEENDYKKINYYLDENILEFASPYMPHQEIELKTFISKIIGEGSFAVDLKDGTFIGNISVLNIIDNDTWEIAYYFNPRYWKKGYAYEACKALIKYSFDNLKCKYLIAQIDKLNLNSRKLVEKLGFKLKNNQKNVELYGRITNKCEYILIK